MKDIWFSDSRDIVKWGVVTCLARQTRQAIAIQLAFYRPERPTDFTLRQLNGDDTEMSLPFPEQPLRAFSRNIGQIKEKGLGVSIEVYDAPFAQASPGDNTYRDCYVKEFIGWLASKRQGRPVILLVDPDTGLERGKGKPAYVRRGELKKLHDALQKDDWLVLYQHAPHKEDWIDDDRQRVARAVERQVADLVVFDCADIAPDVAFFAIQRNDQNP